MTAYPVIFLFLKSFAITRPGEPMVWGLEGWAAAFRDVSLVSVLGTTFALAWARTFLTTAIAIFFAWVITRTDTPLKRLIEFTLWLGFFLPLLPMTMGWILLLDPDHGVINRLLVQTFQLSSPPFNIFSYWGIIWCHLAFSTSVRFLLITPAFRAMDAALEEAARASGANNWQVILGITIPVLAPAILASTALALTKSIESFEVELVLGIPAGIYVLPTTIWNFLHWEPPLYAEATALSSIFLMVVFAVILLQQVLLRGRTYTTVTGRGYSVRPSRLGAWRWVTCGICVSLLILMIFLPLGALLMGTFMEFFGNFDLANPWTTRHWIEAFKDPIFLRSLRNTVVLGIGAAAVGVIWYALLSYYMVRTRLPGRGALEIMCWLPWALPGMLISIALLWTALGSGVFIGIIYGTIYILVLAIIIKEMPLGTQIIKASIMQISEELEEAAAVAGSSWLSSFRRVLLPLVFPTLTAVSLIILISAVRDIPTMIFLATHETRTISLLMLDYMVGANMEKAAVLGVFLVFLIFLLLFLARVLGIRWYVREL